MNRTPLFVAALTLAGFAVAANTTYSLVVNAQVSSERAIVVNGKTYVPLGVLKSLGVTSSLKGTTLSLSNTKPADPNAVAGGANQRPALEGCLGETLFNGVWRIKASKLERISRDPSTPGWALTIEVRNGTKSQLAMTDTGVSGTGEGMQLAFSDASTINVDGLEVQKLTFASLPPGGMVTVRVPFYYPFGTLEDAVKTPTKFLFAINPKGFEDGMRKRGAAYSVPNPSLRVRLDCQK
jgi:hypothetical protein